MNLSTGYRIGQVSRRLSVPIDTLRYYERIGLLPSVGRNGSGIRIFRERDVARVRFILRARTMNFTLAEIAGLLALRDRPRRSRTEVRAMARAKAREIDERIETLRDLRDELTRLADACAGSREGCPVLTGLGEYGAGPAGG